MRSPSTTCLSASEAPSAAIASIAASPYCGSMRAKATPPATGPSAVALAGMFAVTGIIHVLRPGVFDPIVPRHLPWSPRFWTYGSGLAELLLAGLVAWPRTRSLGGLFSAAFLIAVFPANLRTVRIVRQQPMAARVAALARLPLQAPLVAVALRVSRSEGALR